MTEPTSTEFTEAQRALIYGCKVALDAIKKNGLGASDPEKAHCEADALLLNLLLGLSPETAGITHAYAALVGSAPWWAAA